MNHFISAVIVSLALATTALAADKVTFEDTTDPNIMKVTSTDGVTEVVTYVNSDGEKVPAPKAAPAPAPTKAPAPKAAATAPTPAAAKTAVANNDATAEAPPASTTSVPDEEEQSEQTGRDNHKSVNPNRAYVQVDVPGFSSETPQKMKTRDLTELSRLALQRDIAAEQADLATLALVTRQSVVTNQANGNSTVATGAAAVYGNGMYGGGAVGMWTPNGAQMYQHFDRKQAALAPRPGVMNTPPASATADPTAGTEPAASEVADAAKIAADIAAARAAKNNSK